MTYNEDDSEDEGKAKKRQKQVLSHTYSPGITAVETVNVRAVGALLRVRRQYIKEHPAH